MVRFRYKSVSDGGEVVHGILEARDQGAAVSQLHLMGHTPVRVETASSGLAELLIVVVTEPVALGAIQAPGDMGADIVVGEGHGLAVGMRQPRRVTPRAHGR